VDGEPFEDGEVCARAALAGGNAELALTIWDALRAQIPDAISAYVEAGDALASLANFTEADRLYVEAMARFPDQPHVGYAYAMSAHHREDWDETCRRWEYVCQRYPTYPASFARWVVTLLHVSRFDEAERVAAEASVRFPTDLTIAEARACLAEAQNRWAEAIEQWASVRARFPDHVPGYTRAAEMLRKAGMAPEAENLLEAASARFGDHADLLWQRALLATRRQDWATAFSRWERLRKLHPDINLSEGTGELLTRWRLARAENEPMALGTGPPLDFALSAGLEQPVSEAVGRTMSSRELMMRFEGLGTGCDFGLVQRHFGAEPLGLLRWSLITPTDLAAAIRARFSGTGEPENTYVRLNDQGGEYFAGDKRWFVMHTFLWRSEISEDEVFRKACQRFKYLRAKLVEDLDLGEKVFVYRDAELSDPGIAELQQAVQDTFPRATLLIVRGLDGMYEPGQIETLKPRFLMGHVGNFNMPHKYISHDDWDALCRNALREVRV
jgi:hypothetical protein